MRQCGRLRRSSLSPRVLAEHLETFLAQTSDDETRNPLPRFVVRELRDFLACGQLSRG